MRHKHTNQNGAEPPDDWMTQFPSEESVSRKTVEPPKPEEWLSGFPEESPRFRPLIDLNQARGRPPSEGAPAPRTPAVRPAAMSPPVRRTPAAVLASLSAFTGLPRRTIVIAAAVTAAAAVSGATFIGVRAGDGPEPDAIIVDSIAAPIATPAAVRPAVDRPATPSSAQPVTTETATTRTQTQTTRTTEPPRPDKREKPAGGDRERVQPPAPRAVLPPPAPTVLAPPVSRDPVPRVVTPAVNTAAPPPAPTATPVATPTPTPTSTPAPTPTLTPTPTRPATRDAAKEPAPAAPPTLATERAAVQSVLDRYRRAFGTLSSFEIQTFWPTVNTKALDKAFDQLERQEFEFDTCRISLAGSRADAACAGTATFVPKVGSKTPRVEPRRWTFQLVRENGAWVIERVESR